MNKLYIFVLNRQVGRSNWSSVEYISFKRSKTQITSALVQAFDNSEKIINLENDTSKITQQVTYYMLPISDFHNAWNSLRLFRVIIPKVFLGR